MELIKFLNVWIIVQTAAKAPLQVQFSQHWGQDGPITALIITVL